MPHVRTQIRDAAIAALTGLPTTQHRVYAGRTRPLPAHHEPALLVYTREEVSERDAAGRPPILAREVTLVVEGRVHVAVAPDDMLDQIASEVESALAADPRLAGKALDTMLRRTAIEALADGERHVGSVRMEFVVQYRTTQTAPGVAV